MTIQLMYPPYPAGTIDYPGGTLEVQVNEVVTYQDFSPADNQALLMIAYPWDPVSGAPAIVPASTHGYNSFARNVDDPLIFLPATHFPPLLAEGFNFEDQLFDGIDPASGASESGTGFGDITLSDPGGELDDAITRYAWDGRSISIFRPDFTRIAALGCDKVLFSDEEKRLKVKHRQGRLYETPLLGRYDGSGGLGGDAALKGQPIPQAYGRVFNVEPRLINAEKLIYQWHDRQVKAVTSIRDGVSEYTLTGGNFDTYADLDALASVPVGQAVKGSADGCFRLGSAPALSLRLDGWGDDENLLLHGISSMVQFYQETRANILRRIAVSRGPDPVKDSSTLAIAADVDNAAFFRMNVLQPGPVGFYFDSDISIGAACDRIMAGCLGWWRIGLNAKLTVNQLDRQTRADFVIDHPADTKGTPEMMAWSPPRWKTRVGWRHNWAPQLKSELGAATASQQLLYGEEWTYVQAQDDAVQLLHAQAPDVPIAGEYALEGDAVAEAVRQQALLGVDRQRWRIPVRLDPFADVLGRVCQVRGYTRYGLEARLMTVVRVEAVAGLNYVTLDLWG
ncbi:hypothetical protein FHP25_25025 [Vineibacter terrae]|uniref:Phage tail protein n=1 Tax=Vineibacter terrae TaxID=2586908 RepID=A0A5C8PGB0_9HYPH|nr:hypothetical protein [Vineibacter terrae]TXL72562.1 hypothetical protein FHP25_25025 [Vineibacter terrae]